MERTARNIPAIRLVLLTVIAALGLVIVGKKAMSPNPVSAYSSSPAKDYHLVPAENGQGNTKLVLFDAVKQRFLIFTVQSNQLRLNGWRDTSNDHWIWDSHFLKGNRNAATIEQLNGVGAQKMTGKPTEKPIVDYMKEQYKKHQMKGIQRFEQ